VPDELCELRFDISLPPNADARRFERGWREALAAQRLTALAMPPTEVVAARFRVSGPSISTLERYLPTRLAALPGVPHVAAEAASPSSDWQGVRIWLSYRAHDLSALLANAKRSHSVKATRGRRR
jgi:hypothetical protein